MRMIDQAAVHRLLDYPGLIEALRAMFRAGCELPVRHHHTVKTAGAPDGTLLIMPAWRAGGHIGVKIVTVFPGNGARDLPGVMGQYLLLDATTGEPRALVDGTALTARRTGAASALAATYLAREDARTLLMVGTGTLAPHLIGAHAAARPLRRVLIWGRDAAKARALAARLNAPSLEVGATDNLEHAVAQADIVSCATLSHAALILGRWLKPGQHVDLVGGFTPEMREADDEAIRRARVYVDTLDGALKEAGDVVQPLATGVIARSDVHGDLFGLTRGAIAGRGARDEITLFKSVGTALEDLAAAELAYGRAEAAETLHGAGK
ncbi:MAG: ornithine cyclodeaminase family protein [Alphaproteobacteria bacterium]